MTRSQDPEMQSNVLRSQKQPMVNLGLESWHPATCSAVLFWLTHRKMELWIFLTSTSIPFLVLLSRNVSEVFLKLFLSSVSCSCAESEATGKEVNGNEVGLFLCSLRPLTSFLQRKSETLGLRRKILRWNGLWARHLFEFPKKWIVFPS